MTAKKWAWISLAAALAWSTWWRLPLILNGAIHIDSDLAVDGITLMQALDGHWRWHFPGTPHIGSGALLLCLPQALIWGPTPEVLASGGAVGYALLILATFLLAYRVFGPSVAAWSLLPLACGSIGILWLTTRLTGSHILAAAWHAGAFLGLAAALQCQSPLRLFGLGLWCGLGYWLDSMFLVTIAGLVPAALWGWWSADDRRPGLAPAASLVLGVFLGLIPWGLGRWLDGRSSYPDQFALVDSPALIADHARLLRDACLPRLLAGHRLPGLETDPSLQSLGGAGGSSSSPPIFPFLSGVATCLALVLSVFSTFALAFNLFSRRQPPLARSILLGLTLSGLATLAGFLVNRNIFNADNYRYLVTLLVPWSLGFGLSFSSLARRFPRLVSILALAFTLALSADAYTWLRSFGWIAPAGIPARAQPRDPLLALLSRQPDPLPLFAPYWDAYRAQFLTAGRIVGVPFPIYPDRFPEQSRGIPGSVLCWFLYRPGTDADLFFPKARAAGAVEIDRQANLHLFVWSPTPGRLDSP